LLIYSTAAHKKSCEEAERESSLDLDLYSEFFRRKLCCPPPNTVGKFMFMIDE